MKIEEGLEFYLKEGLTIIPLKENSDTKTDVPLLTEEGLKHHKGNFGWNVDYGYIAVDVCAKNSNQNGVESFKRFAKDCGIDEDTIKKMVSVGTPSGGFHLYIKLPQSYKRKMAGGEIKVSPNPKDDKGNEIYPGIDFHTKGEYVVIPPSKMDDKEYRFFQTEKIFNEASSQMLNVIDESFIIKEENQVNSPVDDKKQNLDFWLKILSIIIAVIAVIATLLSRPSVIIHNTPVVPAPDTPLAPAPNIQWTTIDGDTIKSSNKHNTHLYGIDAPELNQSCHTDNKEWPCGRQSKQELQIFIENKKIVCQFKSKDRYGRSVEDCAADGKSVSEYMVENGWAVAYTRYSSKYKDAELKAKNNKLGIWSADCFIEPEKWRRGDRCPN